MNLYIIIDNGKETGWFIATDKQAKDYANRYGFTVLAKHEPNLR